MTHVCSRTKRAAARRQAQLRPCPARPLPLGAVGPAPFSHAKLPHKGSKWAKLLSVPSSIRGVQCRAALQNLGRGLHSLTIPATPRALASVCEATEPADGEARLAPEPPCTLMPPPANPRPWPPLPKDEDSSPKTTVYAKEDAFSPVPEVSNLV